MTTARAQGRRRRDARDPTRVTTRDPARKPARNPAIAADEDTRSEILRVAMEEFAAHGLAGARVDAIAERTRTTKGMIYYYFRSKEKLYIAVLERLYLAVRSAEDNARIVELPPLKALTVLVEKSFDFHCSNPHVSRLISIENINNAKYVRQVPDIREANRSVIASLALILRNGVEAKLFRDDIAAVDLHFFISALCFFRVSNRATFKALFDCDFEAAAVRARQRRLIVEAVLGLVRRPDAGRRPPRPSTGIGRRSAPIA